MRRENPQTDLARFRVGGDGNRMGRPPRSLAPNIVLILTDQQRADTIAALGNDMIKTPVLDRLVSSGTTFTHAYTPSPVCVAARHALITGLPPHHTGVVDNVEQAPVARSFMEMLAARGYQTHGVGKMHFCGESRRAWGFESRDYSEELDESDDYRAFLRAAGYGHVIDPLGIRSEFYYLPQPSQLPAHLHHTAWVANRSIEFLRRRDRRRPFFLWSSFIKPHPPFESPNPWGRLYRSSEMSDPLRANDGADHQTFWNRMQNRYKYMDGGSNAHLNRTQRASYYSAISFIDFHLGRILGELGDEIDDTLVIFTSDHGEMLGDFGCFGKRCMLDASVRVPLIVRLPGRFAPGARCATPVSLLDLFPTFAAVAGAEEQMPWPEARSLEQVARGQAARDHVTSQFSQRSLGLYLLAEESWKYIYSAADRREWLFNLAADPHELENLAAQPSASAQLQRLRAKLIGMLEREGYGWAVEGGKWRDYGITRLPDDARGGLLYQDPSMLRGDVGRLDDYARSPAAAIDWLGATMPAAMDTVSGRISFPQS
jgi:arylsulfatase